VGSLTSHSPIGLHGLLGDSFYFFFLYFYNFIATSYRKIMNEELKIYKEADVFLKGQNKATIVLTEKRW
jgi:hypothetical protein